jgi:hypothetical protein
VHESARERARISVAEVVAYIGAVVLLVGVGFLYGTQYQALGTGGRLVLIGVVVVGALGLGELVQRVGGTAAARRARAAGWALASLAIAIWCTQAFTDAHVLAGRDPTGPALLGTAIGLVVAVGLLWRAGSGLIAAATAVLAYGVAGTFDGYAQLGSRPWTAEITWLIAGAALITLAELLTRGSERLWAREVLRFLGVLPTSAAALILSGLDTNLEILAAVLAVAGFALAVLRGSAGFAVAGGVALFVVVNEIGFRHFAQSVGFPVVLLASGLTLLIVAGGMFKLLPRLGN